MCRACVSQPWGMRGPSRRHVPTADVLLVGDFDAPMLTRAERLRWVHAASGGVEKMLFPDFVASPIPFSCSKGVFDTPGAEHALASMLGFARNLIYDVRHRATRDYVYGSPTELRGKTLGIAGFGRIGRELARLAQAFGMRVIALRRSDAGDHPHVDEMLNRDDLPRLLSESDYLAVAVPNTPETQQFIGAPELALMKPSAYLIDVSGRDVIYDLDALAAALRDGRLAGASLQISPPPGRLAAVGHRHVPSVVPPSHVIGRRAPLAGPLHRKSAPVSGRRDPPQPGRQARGVLRRPAPVAGRVTLVGSERSSLSSQRSGPLSLNGRAVRSPLPRWERARVRVIRDRGWDINH